MIRSLFIPESGCEWGCFDYSQQEPRLVVHYASLDQDTSVFGVKDSYEDGNADFHTIVAKMATYQDHKLKQLILDFFMVWVKQNFKQS